MSPGEVNTGAGREVDPIAGVNVEVAVELAQQWLDSMHPDLDPRDAYTLATAVVQMAESAGFWGRTAARLTQENAQLKAKHEELLGKLRAYRAGQVAL